jgi:hypothetical protein
MLTSVILLLLSFLALILPLIPPVSEWLGNMAPYLLLAWPPLLLTSYVLGLIGPALCLAAPAESRSNELIFLVVLLQFAFLITMVLNYFGQVPLLVLQIMGLGVFVSQFIFLLFLKRLAEYLDRKDLTKLVMSALTLGVIAILCAVVSRLKTVEAAINPFIHLLITLAFPLTTVLAILRYYRSIRYMRRAICKTLTLAHPGG